MSAEQNLINIGTDQKPVRVPRVALESPASPEGNAWWEAVATGTVAISEEAVDKALALVVDDSASQPSALTED
jgi:hypothetical protein